MAMRCLFYRLISSRSKKVPCVMYAGHFLLVEADVKKEEIVIL